MFSKVWINGKTCKKGPLFAKISCFNLFLKVCTPWKANTLWPVTVQHLGVSRSLLVALCVLMPRLAKENKHDKYGGHFFLVLVNLLVTCPQSTHDICGEPST